MPLPELEHVWNAPSFYKGGNKRGCLLSVMRKREPKRR